MSHVVSFRFWRINIISNIFRTFYIVLEENYIAIIIVIELSPSPISSRPNPTKKLGENPVPLLEEWLPFPPTPVLLFFLPITVNYRSQRAHLISWIKTQNVVFYVESLQIRKMYWATFICMTKNYGDLRASERTGACPAANALPHKHFNSARFSRLTSYWAAM